MHYSLLEHTWFQFVSNVFVKLIITRKRVDLFCRAVSLIQSIASGSDRKTELLSPAFAHGILLFYLA